MGRKSLYHHQKNKKLTTKANKVELFYFYFVNEETNKTKYLKNTVINYLISK